MPESGESQEPQEPRDEKPRRRRRRRKPRLETLSLWVETKDAHECPRLCDALQDGLYEVRRWWHQRSQSWRLMLVPKLPWSFRDFDPVTDRLHHCPYCGVQIRLVVAPTDLREPGVGKDRLRVPDVLPKDVI